MAETERSTPPALTAKGIEAEKPGPQDREFRDGEAPGLRLRVTAKGTKVFRWAVIVDSRQRWITLGRWSKTPRAGHVTLSEARVWLGRLKAAHAEGRLDAALAEFHAAWPAAKPEPVPEGAPTVRDFASAFMATIRRRRERPEPVQDIVDDIIIPAIGDRALASITADDVERIVVDVVEGRHAKARNGGAPTHAGKVLQVCKQFFRYAESKDKVPRNPAATLNPDDLGIVNRKCDRHLSPDEIAAFWRALDKGMTPTVRDALRLLLLTGVRSGELLQATWDEIDLDDGKPEAEREPTWTIPVAHQKLTRKARQDGAKPFRVPLSPTAVSILRELRALADSIGSRYVVASFAGKGEPLTDKALNHAMRRLFEGKSPALRFDGERPTPHDLRRTLRQHARQTLRVPFDVSEKLLNHSMGRIAATYDPGDLLDERREALAAWDTYIARLVSGEGAAVVALPVGVRASK